MLHNLLLDCSAQPYFHSNINHLSPSLLQASSIEVLQSLLEANERFRGKVQQQHYADEMLRVSRWLLSQVSVLAHHNCAWACALCLSVLAGRPPVFACVCSFLYHSLALSMTGAAGMIMLSEGFPAVADAAYGHRC